MQTQPSSSTNNGPKVFAISLQDLIAIGLCNVVSSFFRSYVFTGAVARTIIQDKTGGRQQVCAIEFDL